MPLTTDTKKVMFEIYRDSDVGGSYKVVYFTELGEHDKETEIEKAMRGLADTLNGTQQLTYQGRAYDLARAGKDVVLAPRPVTIHSVNILAYEWPRLTLEVSCEGGTYIRSIARDIGEALGCGGLVEILVRTRIGAFTIEDAIDPDTLSAETLKNQMKPAVEAVAQLPVIQISEEQIAEITMGRAITIDIPLPEGEVALLGPSGELVAVGETVRALQRIEPRRVLVGQN